jgi:hypothetical protein
MAAVNLGHSRLARGDAASEHAGADCKSLVSHLRGRTVVP